MLAPATWDSGLPIKLMGQFIKRFINCNFLLWPLGKFIYRSKMAMEYTNSLVNATFGSWKKSC